MILGEDVSGVTIGILAALIVAVILAIYYVWTYLGAEGLSAGPKVDTLLDPAHAHPNERHGANYGEVTPEDLHYATLDDTMLSYMADAHPKEY